MGSKNRQVKHHWISKLPFDKWNYALFFIGLLVIIVGYILMDSGDLNSTQSLTVAPVVLLFGYLIIIPVAIMFQRRSRKEDEE